MKVYSFNGSALSLDANESINSTIKGLAWRANSGYIAVGLSGSSQRLRLYTHTAGALEEATTARVDETYSVYGLDWNSDGSCLAFGRSNGSGAEFRTYCFNPNTVALILQSSEEMGSTVFSVRWSNDDAFVVAGDSRDSVSLYQLSTPRYPMLFNDTHLILHADMQVNISTTFRGNCSINGKGGTLYIRDGSDIVVDDDSTLCFNHMTIANVSGKKIACLSANSKVIFKNVSIVQNGDFELDQGSFEVYGKLKVRGGHTFAYSTSLTSTIKADATLLFDENVTFSYSPASRRNCLIEMEDDTAQLCLKAANIMTATEGLQLITGELTVDGLSHVYSTAREGLILGNNSANDDVTCNFKPGGVLEVTSGALQYKNVNASSWNMFCQSNKLHINSLVHLKLSQRLDVGTGQIFLHGGSTLLKSPGTDIGGSMHITGRITRGTL